MALQRVVYRPRDAEHTVLHQVVAEYLEAFLGAVAEAGDGVGLPQFVEREFPEFLTCGVFEGGVARFQCEGCAREHLVPFSCKGRGWCPSCGGRRMTERAAHLMDAVLPRVPVRQWVLTVPYRLRYRLAWNHGLSRAVLRVYTRVLLDVYARGARARGVPGGRTGSVTVMQRAATGEQCLKLAFWPRNCFSIACLASSGGGRTRTRPSARRRATKEEPFMRSRVIIGLAVLLGLVALVTSAPVAQEWKPNKPITIIVPWPAGGATDLTVRILAAEMEKPLGQRISVVNTPGATGAIGMKNAWDAARDGYTWTANSDTSLVNYPVLDLMKTTHRDWIQWYALFTPSIISVNADYPAKDLADLVRIMKEKPGQVAVASAGVGSSGHTALEVFKSATGVSVRHVPYAGGNPAVVATVSGESNAVMQLSVEQADMIRAKKLRPLANTSDRPLTISGFGEVPPVTKWYPKFPVTGSHFGLMVPKDTPKEVVAAISRAFEIAAKSERLKKFADDKAVLLVNLKEGQALAMAEEAASVVTWTLFDNGAAKISPAQFNIPKPKP